MPSDPTAVPRFYFRAYTSARCRTLPENVTPQRHRIYKYSQPVHGHIRGVPGAVLVDREKSIESIRQLGGFLTILPPRDFCCTEELIPWTWKTGYIPVLLYFSVWS